MLSGRNKFLFYFSDKMKFDCCLRSKCHYHGEFIIHVHFTTKLWYSYYFGVCRWLVAYIEGGTYVGGVWE